MTLQPGCTTEMRLVRAPLMKALLATDRVTKVVFGGRFIEVLRSGERSPVIVMNDADAMRATSDAHAVDPAPLAFLRSRELLAPHATHPMRGGTNRVE